MSICVCACVYVLSICDVFAVVCPWYVYVMFEYVYTCVCVCVCTGLYLYLHVCMCLWYVWHVWGVLVSVCASVSAYVCVAEVGPRGPHMF